MSPRNTVARVLERLVAALSVVILLMSLISIASIVVIQHQVSETAQTISPLVEESTRLRVEVTEAQTNYRAYLLTDDTSFVERYRSSKESYSRGKDEFLETSARGGIDEERVETFLDAGDEWFRLADAEVAKVTDGRRGGLGQTASAFERVTAAHDDLVVEISAARQERRDRYGMTMSGAIALMGLATLLALVITVHQSRRALSRLARPLQALQRVVSRQERGAMQERADVTQGADEVVALASAFNALAESNSAMQREREHRLHLYRVTGNVAGVLTTREGGWDLACGQLGEGLGADAVAVYQVTGTGTADRIGSWRSSGDLFPSAVQELAVPNLARMLAETPILRARDLIEIEASFPAPLPLVAEAQLLEGWVLHPLCFGEEAVGVLSVATHVPHVWDEAEIQAMERVAEYAAHTFVEQRYIGSLEELDQQKSDFMATTSHELRTPLTSIAGYLELLEDGDYGPLAAPQARALDVVSRNVERLRSLIDDLLLLNRLDSGQANTQRHVYDVGRSAARVAEQLAPVAAAAQVELVLDQGERPAHVHADPVQIERAIGNLVSNAVKFTPDGGSVRLTTTVAGAEVHIRCADTGMGIPDEDQARLFTRFYRATNAQAGEVPGTGLGLVIVETIATGHGGSVEVESVEGEGTTVTLTLPATSGPASG